MIKKLVMLACCALFMAGVVAPLTGCGGAPESTQNAPDENHVPMADRPVEEASQAQLIE